MGLLSTLIQHPVKVSVAVLLVALFGLIALQQMPLELTPQVDRPSMSIDTRWPGAGPEEIEREIVLRQEMLMNGIPGLTEMTSWSEDSRGRISMEFEVGTNMSDVMILVSSRLQQIRDYPESVEDPMIWLADDSTSPVVDFVLVRQWPDLERLGEFSQQHPELAGELDRVLKAPNPTLANEWLEELAKQHPELQESVANYVEIAELMRFTERVIADRFSRVAGVARVMVWGGKIPQMQVVFDPYRLAALNLTAADLRDALRSENRDTPAGDLDEGENRFMVKTVGRFHTPKQVEDQIVAMRDGTPIFVGDVAEVGIGYRSSYQASRHFNSPSLWVGVAKLPGANIFDVASGVMKARDELNKGVLAQRGVHLHNIGDKTIYVDSAINLVQRNILVGGTLTVLVLLLFLRNLRSTLVVALAIPVSIVGTFLMLRVLGRSLNVISLAGMAFAVGMLVDNAVVVLENIFRHRQLGESRFNAAVLGTREVWGAALASTLTTMAVFIPILFVQEEAGQLFRDIALAISCGVGLSLIVSVAVIPTAAARLLGRVGGQRRSIWATLLRPADRFGGLCVALIVNINAWLQRSTALRALVVFVFLVGSLCLSYALMPAVEYLPHGNRNQIGGSIVPKPGYSLDHLLSFGEKLHDALRPLAEVIPGSPESEDLQRPILDHLAYGASGGRIWLSARVSDPDRAGEMVPIMREAASQIEGVDVSINQSGLFMRGWNRPPRSIDIDISGPDLDRLVEIAGMIKDRSRELYPDASVTASPGLDLTSPEIHIVPRKFLAADLSLSSSDIGYSVSALVDGAFAGSYVHNGDEVDLVIVSRDTESLPANVPIVVPGSGVLPLSSVAEVTVREGPPQIRHLERQRAITISVTPPEEVALGAAIESIENEVIRPIRDSGELLGLYLISMSGTADRLVATWESLRFNLLVVIVITYLLMAALFESWLYPFVIMISVPLAAVGGLIGLRVVNLFILQQLDILTMLGFVILVGTVVNNAILIVHQSLNHMRDDKLPPNSAILTSVRNRIRPIFMTTCTTTFGLIPLVLLPGAGSELYRGLGSVVLGGLIVSTLFSLFLVPCLFSLILDIKGWLAKSDSPKETAPLQENEVAEPQQLSYP